MANQKLTELTAAATVAATDIIYVVTTPGATPASRKATVSALVAGAGGPTTVPVPIAEGGTAGTTARLARDNLLLFDNNESLRMKNVAGTAVNTVQLTNGDVLSLQSPTIIQATTVSAASTFRLLKLDLYFVGAASGRGINGQDTGTVSRSWLRLNAATNILELGDAGSPSIRALTAFEAASTVKLDNNQKLQWKDSGGTAQNILYLATDNTIHFGAGSTVLYLEPTSVVYSPKSIQFTVNNTPLQARTVAAVARQMLKLNASDVLELGDALTPSISALCPLTLTTPLATTYGGVPSGGTTGQILKKNSATNYDASWQADATVLMLDALERRVAALEAR